MTETNNEKVKRIKDYIKKNQPKVKQQHFNWNQFKKIIPMVYNKELDIYIKKKLEK